MPLEQLRANQSQLEQKSDFPDAGILLAKFGTTIYKSWLFGANEAIQIGTYCKVYNYLVFKIWNSGATGNMWECRV